MGDLISNTHEERLVLNFHGIGLPPDNLDPAEVPYWCDETQFLGILDAIPTIVQQSGMPIEITFDDGNISDAVIATPALVDRGLNAIFFVCANRIGRSNYLDAPDMAELLKAGMGIGSHGWSHVDWRKTNNKTLRKETEYARERIANVISRPVETVAIPFGSYDRRVLRYLKNFKTIFTSDGFRASRRGRIVPRITYIKNWDESTIHKLATHKDAVPERMRRLLVSTYKRLR